MGKKRIYAIVVCVATILNLILTCSKLIQEKSESSVLLGVSIERMALLVFIIILTILFAIASLQILFIKGMVYKYYKIFIIANGKQHQFIYWLSLISFILFLVSNIPSYRLGIWKGYWIFIQPIFFSLFLNLCLLGMVVYFSTLFTQKSYWEAITKKFLPIKANSVGFILAISLFILLVIIQTGAFHDQYFWNVAGVPVLTQYVYLIFGYFCYFNTYVHLYKKNYTVIVSSTIIVCLIFVTSILVLLDTPIANNFFIEDNVPTYYPYSDAQKYDFAGRAFINGLGINFGIPTDKPLYEAYLGILHFLMGEKYNKVISLNVLVLTLIPILLFFMGKELDSEETGVALAIISIIFERTTMESSGIIANIHWKVMMPEPLSQLSIIFSTYAMIKWLKSTTDQHWLFLATIAIGLGTYVRPQTIFLIPVVLLIIAFRYFRYFKLLMNNMAAAIIGFFGTTGPWALYCLAVYDYVPLIGKFKWIMNYRFNLSSSSISISSPKVADLIPTHTFHTSVPVIFFDKFYLVFSHFVNNLIKSLLILPKSLKLESIPEIFENIPYWSEGVAWDGNVSFVFVLSLCVFIIGVAELHKKHKTSGILPFLFFLFYLVALSLSRTSGSRYIVPVIWVIYFYYIFGIIFIARKFSTFIMGNIVSKRRMTSKNEAGAVKTKIKTNKKTPIWFLPLLVGCFLPAADYLFPTNSQLYLNDFSKDQLLHQSQLKDVLKVNEKLWDELINSGDLQIAYGAIIDPILQPSKDSSSTLSFHILGNYWAKNMEFQLSKTEALELESAGFKGSYLLIYCRTETKPTNLNLPIILQSINRSSFFVWQENWANCQELVGE